MFFLPHKKKTTLYSSSSLHPLAHFLLSRSGTLFGWPSQQSGEISFGFGCRGRSSGVRGLPSGRGLGGLGVTGLFALSLWWVTCFDIFFLAQSFLFLWGACRVFFCVFVQNLIVYSSFFVLHLVGFFPASKYIYFAQHLPLFLMLTEPIFSLIFRTTQKAKKHHIKRLAIWVFFLYSSFLHIPPIFLNTLTSPWIPHVCLRGANCFFSAFHQWVFGIL